jgi:hypothetical protein
MHALEGLANSDRVILDDDTEFFPFISVLWEEVHGAELRVLVGNELIL